MMTTLTRTLARTLVWMLYQSTIWGGLLAIRLVKWTGKSPRAVHPKHFLGTEWRNWYLPFLRPTDAALDVGCNNAMHTMEAARRVATVDGFDYSARHLATAQALIERSGLANIRLALASVEDRWCYADGSFDVVLFQDVLEHIIRRDFALREVHRLLKPGGRMLLAVPKRDTRWKALRATYGIFAYSDPDHKIEYTEIELRDELARNGFEIERIEPVVYDTPWAGFIDLVGGFWLGGYRWLAQWKRDAALRHPEESTGFRVVALRDAAPAEDGA